MVLRALHLHPAFRGSGVRCVCVCLGLGFGCAPPFLAGLFGCVYLCARYAFTPPILAEVCGACVWVFLIWLSPLIPGYGAGLRAVPATRQSWLGCAVWMVVLGFGSAAPRDSWLGCWGVCVCVRTRLYPANPGWGSCCLCLGFGFGFHSPILAGLLGFVCCVCALPVPRQSWLECAVWMHQFRFWLSACESLLGCWIVCVCACAPPVPLHPWLGCAMRPSVLGFGLRLRPDIPAWGC